MWATSHHCSSHGGSRPRATVALRPAQRTRQSNSTKARKSDSAAAFSAFWAVPPPSLQLPVTAGMAAGDVRDNMPLHQPWWLSSAGRHGFVVRTTPLPSEELFKAQVEVL